MTPIQLPDNADSFEINDVKVHPEQLWLTLGMADVVEEVQYELKFRNLAHLSISRAVDEDHEGIYQIMGIQVIKTTDPRPILNQLGYSFVSQLPRHDYYYLKSDGDLFIQVVATQFDLVQVANKDSPFKPRIYPPSQS